jgi:aminopeptidase YwaD
MKKIIFLFLLSLPVFSQECRELQNNLKFLSSDSMLGRVPGTQEHEEARAFIFKKLSAVGAVVFEHEFQGGVNLWGVLYPQNNRSGVPEVMITSHYDHIDNCWQKNGHLSSVCNGAADNAAAVSILLNALEKLKGQIKRPVAFAVFDKEEDGLVGSNYFAKSNLLPSIRLVLNLDIVGLNTFQGMENVHLTMGGETGGDKLVKDLKAASQKSGLDTVEFSYALAHGRGDLTNFIQKGIPSIHFTDGDGSVYHSSADEFQNINQIKLLKISNLIFSLTLIAEKNGPYKFMNPFQGENALPSFNDVKSGKNLVSKIKKTIDTPEISKFLKELDKIIKKGEKKFSYPEMSAFQKIAFGLMEYSRNMEEIPQGSRCQN